MSAGGWYLKVGLHGLKGGAQGTHMSTPDGAKARTGSETGCAPRDRGRQDATPLACGFGETKTTNGNRWKAAHILLFQVLACLENITDEPEAVT